MVVTDRLAPGSDQEREPNVARTILELAASRTTGVLRISADRGDASIHFVDGRVTRVQGEMQESLTVYLVRKGLLSAADMRASLAEVESHDVTLAEALEELGLLSAERLNEERKARSREAIEAIVAMGRSAGGLEERRPTGGEGALVFAPVVDGLLRSDLVHPWEDGDAQPGSLLRRTTVFEALADEVPAALGPGELPEEGETVESYLERAGSDGRSLLGALLLGGVVALEEPTLDSPAELEREAEELTDPAEASKLLLAASQSYEEHGAEEEARRAALGALRRAPTLDVALARIEELCLRTEEVATLELVYELVVNAMPGRFGRRSTLYRAGKCFEKALGDDARAFAYYLRAFRESAESGAILSALERTVPPDRGEDVAEALVAVAVRQESVGTARAWLERALAVLSELLGENEAGGALQRLVSECGADEAFSQLSAVVIGGEEAGAGTQESEPIASGADDAGEEEPDDDGLTGLDLFADRPEQVSPGEAQVPRRRAASLDEVGELLEMRSDGSASRRPPSTAEDGEPETGESHDAERAAKGPVPATEGEGDAETALFARHDVVQDLRRRTDELRAAIARDPGDTEKIYALKKVLGEAGDEKGEAAVAALIAVFEGVPTGPPLEPDSPLGEETLLKLAAPLGDPHLRALASLWTAAPQLVRKDLASMGVSRAVPPSPGAPSPAFIAFASARRVLGVSSVRLLEVPSGPTTRVVASEPPAVLAGPSARESTTDLRFRIARSVAMARPDLVIPCALPAAELSVALRALQAAFGNKLARGSLDFASASLAQNLWSALDVELQDEVRRLLADADETDAEGIRTAAMSAANHLGLAATGDVGTALKVAVGDDPFLAGAAPSTRDGFSRAARRSEHVASLVRLALEPLFAQLDWRVARTEP